MLSLMGIKGKSLSVRGRKTHPDIRNTGEKSSMLMRKLPPFSLSKLCCKKANTASASDKLDGDLFRVELYGQEHR